MMHTCIRLLALLGMAALSARPAAAQAGAQPDAVVRGTVHDSIARRPLGGAQVQLVADDTLSQFGQTVVADQQGRFAFERVPNGRYTIGFFHPMLDSLGLEPLLRAVRVEAQQSVQADLAIPGPARLREAICGARGSGNANAVILGFVRDARSRSTLPGVAVAAQWNELAFSKEGVRRLTPRRVTSTKENGWFAICSVPSPGTMTIAAGRAADSTDRIEVQVPVEGFLRRDLYVGTGRASVSGIVVGTLGGQPLANAQVAIAGGGQARSNARGEWTIANAPAGTRTMEVRAVGYYPERRSVDVVDSGAPVHVALATFKSVLDTMKVTANRNRLDNIRGFERRRETGLGFFVTAAEITRREPLYASDVLRTLPGIFFETPQPGDLEDDPSTRVQRMVDSTSSPSELLMLMRGLTAHRCIASIWYNGSQVHGVTAADVDAMMRPKDILGIEVYSATRVPAQFRSALSSCGAVVIWSQ